jgi:GxxExxY protein
MTQKKVNDIAYRIVGCAIEVHKHLGPGLLESVYQECMIEELLCSGLHVESQVHVPLYYRERQLKGKLIIDLLVERNLVVELKAVDVILPVYKAQLLSYLKLTCKPKGLLINFHVENIAQHTIHMVSERFAQLPPS